jgi:hypothetical protein
LILSRRALASWARLRLELAFNSSANIYFLFLLVC